MLQHVEYELAHVFAIVTFGPCLRGAPQTSLLLAEEHVDLVAENN